VLSIGNLPAGKFNCLTAVSRWSQRI